MPFLTDDLGSVLPLITASLVVGVVANVLYLAVPRPWMVSAGELATTGVGLAVLVRMWQVFPFDLATGWTVLARVLLAVALAGSVIAIPVQIVSLTKAIRPARACSVTDPQPRRRGQGPALGRGSDGVARGGPGCRSAGRDVP